MRRTRSLCESCRYSLIVEYADRNDMDVICTATRWERAIRGIVTRCSDYGEKARISIDTMQSVAWEVRPMSDGSVRIIHPSDVEPERRGIVAAGFVRG